MTVFGDTWDYLTTARNWTGDGGMLELLLQQLLLSVTALGLAMLVGLPLALWLGHLGRGGFLAINISNVGRAVPDVRAARRPRDRRLAGHASRSVPTAGPAWRP